MSKNILIAFMFYIKYANTIPKTIAVSLAKLNLCPSLLSKMIVDEMWNKIPITKAVISVWNCNKKLESVAKKVPRGVIIANTNINSKRDNLFKWDCIKKVVSIIAIGK